MRGQGESNSDVSGWQRRVVGDHDLPKSRHVLVSLVDALPTLLFRYYTAPSLQAPNLTRTVVAIRDLEPCAVGGAAARDGQAAVRLRVH